MLRKLKYKNILFDSFCFTDENSIVYKDESNIDTLDEMTGGGWGYICPHCIKKYELYSETDLTESQVDNIINSGEKDTLVCCVDGCHNENAYDINFDIKECSVVFLDNK